MYKTRGAWLQSAGRMLRSCVFVTGCETFTVPPFSVTGYWPTWVRSSSRAVAGTVALCESRTGFPHVCIREDIDRPEDILRYLTHEMIHVMDDGASGHRGQFARVHQAIGMTGRRTESEVSPQLAFTLSAIAEKLGPYPKTWMEV